MTTPVPELQAGDRLTRDEFERRYHAMPNLKKAELIEGVVYVPSPVRHEQHGGPHAFLMGWLWTYMGSTPGVEVSDNATVRLDLENEPQPDALLRIAPARGGQSSSEDGYIAGAPELVAEVAASSASYDLHDKLRAYRRNGVREYVVWRVLDGELDWFVLRGGRFELLAPGEDGLLRSAAFPGLWLDPSAMLAQDVPRILEGLRQGCSDPGHAAFIERLAQG